MNVDMVIFLNKNKVTFCYSWIGHFNVKRFNSEPQTLLPLSAAFLLCLNKAFESLNVDIIAIKHPFWNKYLIMEELNYYFFSFFPLIID